MKIIRLTVENIKRIKAATITPGDKPVVVIGGRNGQGKSSALDSIAYVLGGNSELPDMPVRIGQAKGFAEIDLGDLIARRTVTASGGSNIVVVNKDGAKYGSPQTILDKLTGKLCFDPLDFTRLSPKAQAEALRKLVGLDFTAIDAERQTLYDERTYANRKTRDMQGVLSAMPLYAGMPEQEIDISAHTARLAAVKGQTEAVARMESEASKALADATEYDRRHVAYEAQIAEFERKIEALRKLMAEVDAAKKTADLRYADLCVEIGKAKESIPDTAAIRAEIAAAQDSNQKIRANAARAAASAKVDAAKREADALSEKIDAVDARKAAMLAGAKWPVPGIGYGPNGVTYNGIPFEQCSAAEKLRISVAMGLAMNPKLRVLLVRDGSLLDEQSKQILTDMAAAADAQVWLECVGEGQEGAVIFEDGEIKQTETEDTRQQTLGLEPEPPARPSVA